MAQPGLGERFFGAIGAGEFDELEALLAEDVTFRILLPPGLRSCTGATATADYFRGWFGPVAISKHQSCNGDPYPFLQTTSRRLLAGEVGEPIAGRVPIRYRLALQNKRGDCRCEQSGFYQVGDAGSIAVLDLVCSGVRPI